MSTRKTMIFSDSTCDLTPEMVKERDIRINALTVVFGDERHRDGIDVTPDDVYEFYKKSGTLAKTTASNIAEHEDFIKGNLADGCGAVYFSISSEMSVNYNNTRIAAEGFDNVYVIDSRNLSTGIGLLVLHAADLADKGKTAKEIYDEITALTDKVDASFVVDTLEYLHKGGRCSSVAALGANLLKLRPLIQVKNGKMDVAKKYRGKMTEVLKQYVAEKIADPDTVAGNRIFITHSGACDEIAEELKATVSEVFPDKEILISRAGCTVSVHCGPGTLGILMIRKEAI
jgi:DegV family protein with EDD domain